MGNQQISKHTGSGTISLYRTRDQIKLQDTLRCALQRQLLQTALVEKSVPHFDGARLRALSTPSESRTLEQQQMVDYADTLIAELQEAIVLLIAAPMYNFTIPSMLK